MRTRRQISMNDRGPRWLLPVLGLSLLALAAFAYRFEPALYFRILTGVMMTPQPTPFIDAQQIPAVVACWKHGVDVYVTDPCDPMQRPFAYSPLWLRAGFIPAWNYSMGIGLDSALLLLLALLPPPRLRAGPAVMILALCSSMPVFALERGNIDIVMFVLILIGGWCWSRSLPLRLLGYSFFALAGLLKFYPLVLFVLFLRERIVIFAGLCLAGCGLILAFGWRFRGELREMAQNLPLFSNFTDAFGSRQLPGGLEQVLPYFFRAAGIDNRFVLALPAHGFFSFVVWVSLIAAASAFALRLAKHQAAIAALAALAPGERGFLVIGAAIFCGCFFAQENGSYRGIELLFVLPGLLALAAAPQVGRMFTATVAAVMFVMWGMTIQLLVAGLSHASAYPMGGSIAIYIYWVIHELTWWWIISVFLGVLFCFIGQSPVWLRLRRPTARTRRAAA